MTDQTTDQESPLHSITKPAFEKDPWDHDYYEFVDTVDANLKLSGLIADRPLTGDAPDDAWYEATDEGIIYRNDPNNGWVAIAGLGSSSDRIPGTAYYNAINATTATVQDATFPNSVTDPAGVGHTGELADLADVRTNEEIEDLVATLLLAQGNISITHDDANDEIQVDTSALNEEEVEDAVATLVASGGNLAWNYDDANDTLTVSLSGPITGVQIGTDASPVSAVYATEISFGVVTKSADFTTGSEATHYSVDTSGGSVTATLTTPSDAEPPIKSIKRNGGHTLTIDTGGSATIEDEDSIELTQDGEAVTVAYVEEDDNWEVW